MDSNFFVENPAKKLDTEKSGFNPWVTGWEVTELSGINQSWRNCGPTMRPAPFHATIASLALRMTTVHSTIALLQIMMILPERWEFPVCFCELGPYTGENADDTEAMPYNEAEEAEMQRQAEEDSRRQ